MSSPWELQVTPGSHSSSVLSSGEFCSDFAEFNKHPPPCNSSAITRLQILHRVGYLIKWGHPRSSDLKWNLGAMWLSSLTLGVSSGREEDLPGLTEFSDRSKVRSQISSPQPTFCFIPPHPIALFLPGIPNSHPTVREVSQTPVQPSGAMKSHLPANVAGRSRKDGWTGWKR